MSFRTTHASRKLLLGLSPRVSIALAEYAAVLLTRGFAQFGVLEVMVFSRTLTMSNHPTSLTIVYVSARLEEPNWAVARRLRSLIFRKANNHLVDRILMPAFGPAAVAECVFSLAISDVAHMYPASACMPA
jgi:hypothetical protein